MYSKKRSEPDGPHLLTSLPPKKLMYLQHPAPQSGSSLDSTPTCLVERDFAAQYADTTTADRNHSVTVGKRCFTRSPRIVDIEECSNLSRVEYSEAPVSGVTFQKELNLHHAREPDAEYDSASVMRHVGSCDDSVFLKSKRFKLDEICCNENVDKWGIRCNQTDVGKHGILCNETRADKRVTFLRSRVQENLLSISRDSSNTSLTHPRQSEPVSEAPSSPKHVVISPQISSIESLYAPFLDGDAMKTKSPPPSYVLSSGRLSLQEEGRLGRRAPTIDDDFQEYFSSLML